MQVSASNYQCNAANLNQSKPQFQLELSLAQFSPSLLLHFSEHPAKSPTQVMGQSEIVVLVVFYSAYNCYI